MSSTLATTPAPTRRRRWLVPVLIVVAWLLVSGATGPFAGKLSEVIKNDNAAFLPAKAEATLAINAQKKLVGENQPFVGTLIFEYADGVTPGAQAKVDALIAKIPSLAVEEGKTVGDFLLPVPVGSQVSKDGKAISTLFFFDSQKSSKPFASGKSPIAISVQAIRNEMKVEGLDGHVGGLAGLFGDLIGVFSSINGSLLYSTVGVVFVILIFVYRSPLLPIIVLLAVGIGDALAQAVVYFMAKAGVIDLNGQAQGILLILVFGVGTDYSLLLVSRFREELRNYESKYDAMRVTLKGVIEPITASAATVAAGLLCLSFSVLTSNKSTGPVCAAGVASVYVAVLTLLPALLLLIGRRGFWPRKPAFGSDHPEEKGIWGKVAGTVGRRPRRSWILGTAFVLILCAFLPTLKAGGLDKSFTKRTDSVIADEATARHFPAGRGSPLNILGGADKLEDIKQIALSIPGIAGAAFYTGIPEGTPGAEMAPPKVVDGIGEVDAVLKYEANSPEAFKVLKSLRASLHSQLGPNVYVGGFTAINFDSQEASTRDRNVIIPIVLFVILLILMLLLRSIIAPILLMLTVAASFVATLGACALVFNHIFHFPGSDASFPLFAFTFLVALGVDYNIFLMTRVREEALGMGTRPGTLKALMVTGGVITSAGVVLAATFAVLGVLPLIVLAELGFAVGFGVLLDTILVRSIIVPALVHDIGPAVWWPSKLRHDPAVIKG